MASAPANEPAMAPKGQKHTAFSGELIKVLQEGIESEKEELTLKEIFEHILREFRRRPNVPEPQSANMQDADKIVFARNQRLKGGINKRLDALEKKIYARLTDQENRIQQLVLNMRSEDKPVQPFYSKSDKKITPLLRLIIWFINIIIVAWPSFTYFSYQVFMSRGENLIFLFMIIVMEAGIMSIALWESRRGQYFFFPRWYQPLQAFKASVLGLMLLFLTFILSWVLFSIDRY